jgi:hypothetical protein
MRTYEIEVFHAGGLVRSYSVDADKSEAEEGMVWFYVKDAGYSGGFRMVAAYPASVTAITSVTDKKEEKLSL